MQGQPFLALQDPLRLAEGSLQVPQQIVPLLGLLDGTRDLEALRAGFMLRTGVQLMHDQLSSFIQQLDDTFLLESQRFRDAIDEALLIYRSSPFRTPALAGAGYPDDRSELLAAFDGYCRDTPSDGTESPGSVVGVISPHIDYHRGWKTYAKTWLPAKAAVEHAELVIVLGTDHAGRPGSFTLTRQDYATPWGALPTDTELVGQLAAILGEEDAFAEEVHHIGEHSIELASVWLHYVAGGRPKRILPVLCGLPQILCDGRDRDANSVQDALVLLSKVAAQQNTLVVAAGDLSHVGPAFGDSLPYDLAGRARIRASDQEWLDVVCSGDTERLEDHLLRNGDPTRVCGASPILYMMSILGNVTGKVVAYEQCPADEEFGSLVSVAGVLYTV